METIEIIARLEEIDEILSNMEQTLHGDESDNCAKARKLLNELEKRLNK